MYTEQLWIWCWRARRFATTGVLFQTVPKIVWRFCTVAVHLRWPVVQNCGGSAVAICGCGPVLDKVVDVPFVVQCVDKVVDVPVVQVLVAPLVVDVLAVAVH